MTARFKVPIALGVAAAAMAYLLVSGVRRNDLYMSTLDQLDRGRAAREGVRVMGFVADGSVQEAPGELLTTFTIRNEASTLTLPVRYRGVLPDMFRDGAAVIASGRLEPDGSFAASDLMTKCPSKYEGMDVPHGTPAGAPRG